MRRLLLAAAPPAVIGAPPLLGDIARRTPRVTQRMAAAHGTLFLHTEGRVLPRWFAYWRGTRAGRAVAP